MYHELELPSALEKFSTKLMSKFNKLTRNFTKSNARSTSIISEVESTDHVFMTDDFSYVSYVLLDGLALVPTSETYYDIITTFNSKLQAEMKAGHYIEDCFATYQDNVEKRIGVYLNGREEAAKKIGLNVTAKDESLKRMLVPQMFFESHIIALVTPNIRNLYANDDLSPKDNLPDIPLSEHYMDAYRVGAGDKLLTTHELFVREFIDFINDRNCNISGSLLNHKDAKSNIKSFTTTKSSDALISDMPELNLTPTGPSSFGDSDLDPLLGKDFHGAFFPTEPSTHPKDANVIVVGDRCYLTVLVDAYSKGPLSYNQLHEVLLEKKIPYICKTRIGGSPLDLKKKEFTASKSVWAKTGSVSQEKFKTAFQVLRDYERNNTVVNVSQSFMTWSDGLDEASIKRLYSNAHNLTNAIEKWTSAENNKCHIDTVTPLQSFFSSMPCVLRSTAPKIPHALVDVVARCPYMRPSLPYTNTGDMLLMDRDGKALPFDPLIGRTAKVTFLVGAMGSGKTVFAQALRDKMICKKGNSNIPFQFSLDVGASTEASTLAYAQENPELADKFAFIRMEQVDLNILDTPLGLRNLPRQLLSAITSLVADRLMGVDGNEMPQASDLLGECIMHAYEEKAHPSTANRIRLEDFDGLKKILESLNFQFSDSSIEDGDMYEKSTKYIGWDIVDFLILHNQEEMAYKVQTYCVPLMTDVLTSSTRPDWQEKYRITVNNVVLSDVFQLKLESFINSYNNVCRPSTVTIWNKHICTFELGQVVTQGGNKEDEYKSRFWFGLIFIFIRNTLSLENSFIKIYGDQVDREQPYRTQQPYKDESNKGIKAYHADKIRQLVNSPKRSYVDEVHRFLPVDLSRAGYAQTILNSFINEVRRSGTELAFASPQPAHGAFFNDVATLIIILGFQSNAMADNCVKSFGLSQEEVDRYIKPLRLSHTKGANFFMILRDIAKISKISEFRQVGYAPVPMVEIWSYANEFIEVYIRNRLYQELGAEKALIILAVALPKAGASEMILKAVRDASASNSKNKDGTEQTEEEKEKAQAAAGDNVVNAILSNVQHWHKQALIKIYGKTENEASDIAESGN